MHKSTGGVGTKITMTAPLHKANRRLQLAVFLLLLLFTALAAPSAARAAIAPVEPASDDRGVYLLSEAARLLGDFLDFADGAVEESFRVVIKALGICLVTQMACDTCCDFGQNALAGKLELAAKIAILAISFPLFKQLFSLIERLL